MVTMGDSFFGKIGDPTKPLVSAPFAVVQILPFFGGYLGQICILKMDAETAPFNSAIWDEFSEQH